MEEEIKSPLKDKKFKKQYKSMTQRIKKHTRKSFKLRRQWPPEDRKAANWEFNGLSCYVLHWNYNYCGYVIVPSVHPDSKKIFDDVSVDVHGGLTYRQAVRGGTVFGFDTAHSGDFMMMGIPGTTPIIHDGRRWDIEDMIFETNNLAKQLVERQNHKCQAT